jgi:hypothetical protein
MLTKKHFQAVATILGPDAKTKIPAKYRLDVAMEFAQYFQQENPDFDQKRFLKACGFEIETKQKKNAKR